MFLDMNGYYQVSNLGRVRSLDRKVNAKNKSYKIMKGKILKQSVNIRGYLMVDLSKNAKRRKYFTHILVAQAFITNPDNKPQVNHIKEFEKTNNTVENLEWCTCKYNCNYGSRNERIKIKNKERWIKSA